MLYKQRSILRCFYNVCSKHRLNFLEALWLLLHRSSTAWYLALFLVAELSGSMLNKGQHSTGLGTWHLLYVLWWHTECFVEFPRHELKFQILTDTNDSASLEQNKLHNSQLNVINLFNPVSDDLSNLYPHTLKFSAFTYCLSFIDYINNYRSSSMEYLFHFNAGHSTLSSLSLKLLLDPL